MLPCSPRRDPPAPGIGHFHSGFLTEAAQADQARCIGERDGKAGQATSSPQIPLKGLPGQRSGKWTDLQGEKTIFRSIVLNDFELHLAFTCAQ
jgi:hypothetical protein